MAALAPPPNTAGILLPPVTANPASLTDITNAKEYVERLAASKTANQPQHATDDDIGSAELYKAAVIFAHAPVGDVAPAWLANLNADIANLTNIMQLTADNVINLHGMVQQNSANIATMEQCLHQKFEELPIILANAQAGNRGPLHNPTAVPKFMNNKGRFLHESG